MAMAVPAVPLDWRPPLLLAFPPLAELPPVVLAPAVAAPALALLVVPAASFDVKLPAPSLPPQATKVAAGTNAKMMALMVLERFGICLSPQ